MERIVSNTEPIRVLMVEDENPDQRMGGGNAGRTGLRRATAANGLDALRCLASAPVDMLFTDINLPGGMDGTALARRARELSPGLPVVYASGAWSCSTPKSRVPGSIFVPKPYVPALIGRLIANAVKRRPPSA